MELNEIFYQHYWWFLISLLGAILVFLLFVQGGQSLLATMGKNELEKSMMVNSLGRKWEFTFTTLVVFGGAFFASFPLFYSTSFGGAYWLWMAILFSFIIQAVSYEYRSKSGNFLGKKTYDIFLLINGIMWHIAEPHCQLFVFCPAHNRISKKATCIALHCRVWQFSLAYLYYDISQLRHRR